ncbi:hypothetical protein L2E82_20336 [Cichorium intybus]|uniref:Uncharacterized protein n=1 Tax=Cichorium intybus TaxID=13427 RepID=A0ACB9DTE1_CICIN|nr:hypothetical protein L2E82_20336 [Cichorium intybus]
MKDHDHDDVVLDEGEAKVYGPTPMQQVLVIPPPFSQRILRGDSLKVAGVPPEIQFSDNFKTSRDFIFPRNSGAKVPPNYNSSMKDFAVELNFEDRRE